APLFLLTGGADQLIRVSMGAMLVRSSPAVRNHYRVVRPPVAISVRKGAHSPTYWWTSQGRQSSCSFGKNSLIDELPIFSVFEGRANIRQLARFPEDTQRIHVAVFNVFPCALRVKF